MECEIGYSNQLACASLHKVAHAFVMAGCTTYFPASGASPVDLIVQKNGVIYRIEVKSSGQVNKYMGYEVDLRTKYHNAQGFRSKKMDVDAWDILAVWLTGPDVLCYLLPEEINAKRVITFRFANDKRRSGRVYIVEDYMDIERVLA